MPNIVTYESKSNITPSDKGINAAEQAAVMYQRTGNKISGDIQHTFNDIADKVERHNAIMETSELYKTGTELKMNLQKRYEEESALPENRNDPTFGDRFMAEVAPLLDQWGEGAGTDHGKQLATTLKAGIRNELFNHVAAGQAEMDSAHVQDNLQQTGNMLGSGVIVDPSIENLNRSIGTMKDSVDGMTMAIPDVSMREQVRTEMLNRYLPQLVISRYNGVAEAIKSQIAETGGETSPALEQLNKDIAAQVGFQYLTPDTQTKLTKLGEQAVSQGQELFNSRNATAKAQATDAGNARYAEIHSKITELALNGQGPTPDLIEAIQDFSKTYGTTNSGQVAALDSFLISGADRAQRNAVQPFNQKTRDDIQSGFSLPKGDPRRPTLATLTRDYSSGLITREDLAGYTEILNKLDKPQDDPAFKAAWDNFVRWRDATAASIGGSNPSNPNNAAVRSRFINDVTNNFMARGKAMGDWDRAYDRVTNPNTPGSFANPTILKVYNDGANRGINWLNNVRGWPQWNPNNNTLIWPSGPGGGRPAAPTIGGDVPPPPPGFTGGPPPAPVIDQKAVDELLLGKQ